MTSDPDYFSTWNPVIFLPGILVRALAAVVRFSQPGGQQPVATPPVCDFLFIIQCTVHYILLIYKIYLIWGTVLNFLTGQPQLIRGERPADLIKGGRDRIVNF